MNKTDRALPPKATVTLTIKEFHESVEIAVSNAKYDMAKRLATDIYRNASRIASYPEFESYILERLTYWEKQL